MITNFSFEKSTFTTKTILSKNQISSLATKRFVGSKLLHKITKYVTFYLFFFFLSINTLNLNTVNFKVTVARHQNSPECLGINKNKTYKREQGQEINIIKLLRKLLEGFNYSDGNLLNKRLLESFNG